MIEAVRRSPRPRVWRGLCGLLVALAGPLEARVRAQVPAVEVAGGVMWTDRADLGASDAALRANGPASSSYPVFASRTQLGRATGIEARVAVAVWRRVTVEGRVSMGHPTLVTTVSGDIEGASGLTATDRLDAYRFDGSAVFHWPEWRLAGATPFMTAGAGYLRLRHEGRLLIEDKATYHAGGGVRRTFWSAPRGLVTSLALVGDGRLLVVPGGFAVTGRRVRTVTVSVMLAAGL